MSPHVTSLHLTVTSRLNRLHSIRTECAAIGRSHGELGRLTATVGAISSFIPRTADQLVFVELADSYNNTRPMMAMIGNGLLHHAQACVIDRVRAGEVESTARTKRRDRL